ncbi:MAG: hypothetical protein LC641_00710 [Spirochaeta sp.]|nr:hypothetical protein [Spirochaeta sp.]
MQAGYYPELRRARGYRLYTRSGGRLLDLYQDDGRAFLGHDPKGVSRAMKAEMDRGLHAACPSPHLRRLQRELTVLWQGLSGRADSGGAPAPASSGRHWLVFSSREQFRQAVGEAACVLWRPGLGLLDAGPFDTGSAALATPVGASDDAAAADSVVELRLPLPGAYATVVAGFPKGAATEALVHEQHCAPVQLVGLHRVVNLLRNDPRLWGGRITYDTLEAAWVGLSTPLFVRDGAYLQPQVQEGSYAAFHLGMMKRGFFLNPSSHGLSIIPGECSAGEFAGFARACKDLKEFAHVS